ncbi:uncharacterized protein LOC135847994 [Planococcus citri]|uniref:uncharacterized protein LOC135847994 n=1 Tax=Planococcus citri TaxID=170843 RepID=UPI0031F80FBD
MLPKVVFIFVFVSLFDHFLAISTPPSACDVFSSKSKLAPTPHNRRSPINVITKTATKIHVNSSLIIENGILTPLKVVNTGYALEAYSYDVDHSTIQTHGGVLCDKTYIFYKVVFYTSDHPEISSYTQIDGKGSPLTLGLIYFNQAYGSFNESLNHSDGLVIQYFQIGFAPTRSPLFFPFKSLFPLLRKPNSHITLPAIVVYASFNKLSVLYGYYAYYGSYIDLSTGKQYPCAIAILADRTVYTISESQFEESFLSLKNVHGGTLVSRQPIQETGKRKIYIADQKLYGKFHLF